MSPSAKKKTPPVKRTRSNKPHPALAESSFAFLNAFDQALLAEDKSPATVRGYRNDAQQFAIWLSQMRGESYQTIQDLVRAITPTGIREYKSHLLNVQRANPATINRRLIVLRVLTRWARREGWIEGDPVNGIKSVQEVKKPPRWLDRKEQSALRRAAKKEGNVRNLAIFLLLLNTGLRVSEVAALKLGDLQFSERKGEIVVPGKGTKVRTVPLNADARKALREYLANRPKVEHAGVFVGQKGEPLGWLGIEYVIKSLTHLANLDASAGAPRVTPHTLRHTFAKNLIDQGVSLDQVAVLMGHRNLTTTARYTQPSLQDLARAVEKLTLE